jgi:hypothetical protein
MKFLLNRRERIRYLGFDDRWVLLVGIPAISLVSFILFTAGGADLSIRDTIGCLILGVLFTAGYWTINRNSTLLLRQRFPRQEDTPLRISLMVGVAILSVLLIDIGVNRILQLVAHDVMPAHWGDTPGLFSFAASLTLCVMVLGGYEAVYFFTKYRHSLLEQERLAKANMQAQLAALKQQVNPHFLFNSLNTLTNLIPEDADKAVLFTQRLSAVYRRILEYRHRELIPLREELEALRDYIFLMQTRFEDKLRVEWDVGGARPRVQAEIVPLSLQLLVENAIKHNIVSAEHPLLIRVRVTEDAVEVSNTLNLRSRSLHSTGWGQDSIRKRYRMVTERPVEVEQTYNHYRVTLPLITTPILRYATA